MTAYDASKIKKAIGFEFRSIEEMVKNAVEDTVSLVNIAASGLNENSRGIELSRKIIELYVSKQELPIEIALQNLKTEIQEIF